jgi:hypothetical protein
MREQLEKSLDLYAFHELARRSSGDVEITLLWWPAGDLLTVMVFEQDTGSRFEVSVGERSPLEVFFHPYAYAPVASDA